MNEKYQHEFEDWKVTGRTFWRCLACRTYYPSNFDEKDHTCEKCLAAERTRKEKNVQTCWRCPQCEQRHQVRGLDNPDYKCTNCGWAAEDLPSSFDTDHLEPKENFEWECRECLSRFPIYPTDELANPPDCLKCANDCGKSPLRLTWKKRIRREEEVTEMKEAISSASYAVVSAAACILGFTLSAAAITAGFWGLHRVVEKLRNRE